jgi:hypothetical protein
MNYQNTPALAGKKVRALLVTALLMSIVAGALFVPAMAGNSENQICPYNPGGSITDCPGPIIDPFPFPLPPCPFPPFPLWPVFPRPTWPL